VRGDLNGDQVVDLVVPLVDFSVSEVVSSVVLTFMDRDGLPVRSVELTDARQPRDAAITDVDRDGRADLVVLDVHGEVLVHLQKTDGSFDAPTPFAVGERPFRLIVGRWDGDAVDDLLTVNEGGQSVCVLPGRGDGTFEPARFTTFDAFGLRDAAAGDLDRDGALDLALITFSNGFVLPGLGNGRFGAPQPFPTGESVTALRVADVNGDTFLDIVQTNYNSRDLRVLEGDGAGGFTPGFEFSVGSACIGTVEIGDLDGDGIVDIALGTNLGITPLLGLGGGDFSAGLPFSPGGSQTDFALGDADDDLDVDLISVIADFDGLGGASTFLTVLDGKGDGDFEGPCSYDAGPNGRALVVGDFVSDGVPDLAVLNDAPAISVLGGLGDGSFGARIETLLTGFVDVLASSDLDGNTLDDLLVGGSTFTAGDLTFLSSTGAGTFDPPLTFSAGGVDPTAIRVTDLDSDLLPDLVVCNRSSNQIAVHLGVSGGFSKPLRFGVGARPAEVELADLDGDGTFDAAVANQSEDTASVLIGNGDGTFRPDVPFEAFDGPEQLEIGDLDEDGIDDLAVLCTAETFVRSEIIILSGRGDGTFVPRQTVPEVAAGVVRLTAADLDRDGLLDLVTSSFGRLFVHLADGPASYEPPRTFAASQFVGGVEVADFDADGKKDIVLLTNGQALVFLNQGP
jgi:hypothetical protein